MTMIIQKFELTPTTNNNEVVLVIPECAVVVGFNHVRTNPSLLSWSNQFIAFALFRETGPLVKRTFKLVYGGNIAPVEITDNCRYIGTSILDYDGPWHLFEVTGGT